MGRYLKDIIKYMIDSLQSTEGIVVGHLNHWLWCWIIWNLVCFTSQLREWGVEPKGADLKSQMRLIVVVKKDFLCCTYIAEARDRLSL